MKGLEWAKEIRELSEKYMMPKQAADVHSLLETYLIDPSEEMKQDIEKIVYDAKLKALENTLKYPAKLVEDGEYLVGWVEDDSHCKKRFLLKDDEVMKHILIPGTIGSGKTNVSILLACELMKKGKKVWNLDWKKSWRYIFQLNDMQQKDIHVFTIGGKEFPFYFNPLIPPKGSDAQEWLKKITDHICHTYYLGEGVKHILHKALDHCYREFGVYDGKQNYPTFRNVLQFLENYKPVGRERDWISSALRGIEELCFGYIGNVLNQGNYPLDELVNRNVIFELDSLDENDKTFVMGMLLVWDYFYHLNQETREHLSQVIFLEEAHNLIKRQQNPTKQEPIMNMIVKQIRELGVGVVIIDQDPSLLSIPVLNNTYTTISFNLKERSNVRTIASALLLEDPSLLSKLPVGQAIVRLQDGRQGKNFEPFLVSVPKLPVDKQKPIPLQALKVRMEQFYEQLGLKEQNSDLFGKSAQNSNPTKITERETRAEKNGKQQQTKGKQKMAEKEIGQGRKEPNVNLAIEEKILLADILENPVSQVTERYARLKLNAYKGNKAVRQLEEKNLIESVNLTIANRYWGKALVLAQAGKACLAKQGYDVSGIETKRHGGLKHQLCVQLIADKFRREGCKVEIEKTLGNGKATDILVNGNLAVEVEVEGKHVIENVEKNLAQGYAVLLACESESSKPKVEKKLEQAGLLGKAMVYTVADVLKNATTKSSDGK